MNVVPSVYRFASIEVRPAERTVLVNQRQSALGARAFDVLVALIERRDRVVSKNELLDIVWPGRVVEENNLSVQISALRKALGMQPIATVTGRGYRFVALLDDGTAAPRNSSQPQVERRLAAVVSLEVMGVDKAGAGSGAGRTDEAVGRDWQSVRDTLILATASAADGRAVEITPASSLLEFSSAVSAARWAQQLMADVSEGRASGNTRIHARIGIAIEDVIVEEGRLLGEGVALAHALCDAAQWDTVVTSPLVSTVAQRKLGARWNELPEIHVGGQSLKAVEMIPLEGLRSPAAVTPRPPSRRAPGLAVLPFDCASEESYFGDGITEEIIAALSSNRALFVISRHSTLRYRGSTADPAQIAAELNVRYLLQGSLRRQGTRMRITAELVDAPQARTIWSDRFEGSGEDIFDIQRSIAARMAGAIDPWVQTAEIAHVGERPTVNLSAYECVLRGLSMQFRFDDISFADAGLLFSQAVALDPSYAQAHAHLAWWHNLRYGEGRGRDAGQDGLAAMLHARQALDLDPHDPWVLTVAGHIHAFAGRRFDEAMSMFDQALSMNPNCAPAWARSATTLAYIGRGEEALDRVDTAQRLSPFDPQFFTFNTTRGTACLVCGRPDEAVGWLSKARSQNPGYRASWRMLVAALALAGELEEARQVGQEFLENDPAFRISHFGTWYPMQAPHLQRVLDGLRLAGLPE